MRSCDARETSDIYVTYDEMLQALDKLRRRKAGGVTVITSELLLCRGMDMYERL